ncbi:MAG: XdhC/CoxI family protein [Thermoleophilia bacterium]|nr:XdhC/CoxI family protein [Thermoleophilia bacterium]
MDTIGLYRAMADLTEQGTPFVLATVIESLGSTPRKTGAKMVVLADGRTLDTIGGGKVEAQAIADALDALKRGLSRTAEYELRPTGENALGMVCGGQVKVFLEVNGPANTLLIIGAGHISQKLCPMAKLLDFRVVVLDGRPEFATAERFPQADTVIVGQPKDVLQLTLVDGRTSVVIVTHAHVYDQDALGAVAESDAAYVGMIGSRTKVRTVKAHLQESGVSPEALARVRAPVGLDLGGQTPGEIAVSILAQIIAERHGKVASPGDTLVPSLVGTEDEAG